MGKLNSFQGWTGSFVLRCFSAAIRIMPLEMALAIGRFFGDMAMLLSPRQRFIVIGHLKVAFGKTRPIAEIMRMARGFYHAYGQSIIELARLPLIARHGYAPLIELHGTEHVHAAMKQGRGCLFLAIHSGNWELSNVVGSMLGYPYNMVANDLKHINKVAEFLNELRSSAGCRIINPGIGGREIIRRLLKNEIVTLVADQGGAEGAQVPFFGKDASMSTGAVRIALKYNVPLMLVSMRRMEHGHHKLMALPFALEDTGNMEKDLESNLRCMMRQYETWVAEQPQEYIWFYKTWKYAKDRLALILDDGRVGHLRQSQAVVRAYAAAAAERGLKVAVETVPVKFKNALAARALPFISGGRVLFAGMDMDFLRHFLDKDSLAALHRIRPDIVVSCGARNTSVNWWVSQEARARSVAVLPDRLVDAAAFDLTLMHQHDLKGRKASPNRVVTKGALNLMDKAYLDENGSAFLARYQHLRHNPRTKIALLIGGDARGVVMSEASMKTVLCQVRDAAGECGGDLLITTSRRTPPAIEQMVTDVFKDHPRVAALVVASKGNFPEAVGGILALADIVVVSGESVSMVSEAASSGKQTIVFPVGPCRHNKYQKFCDLLAAQGHIIHVAPEGIAAAVDSVLKKKAVTTPVHDGEALTAVMRKIIR